MFKENEIRIEELEEVYLKAERLIALCQLIKPDDNDIASLKFAGDGLKQYLKWTYKFLKDQGYVH